MIYSLKKHFIENNFLIREEKNGLTVYERENNIFHFYKDLTWNEIKNKIVLNSESIKKFLFLNKDKISDDLDSKYPLNINWLVADNCNLNCIYCFADDKFYLNSKTDFKETIESILNLNPITVTLSGGEPTLNPNLEKILNSLLGKVMIIIDTNGLNSKIVSMIPLLQKGNVMVRISVDSFEDDIINKVRPLKVNSKNKISEGKILKENLSKLVEANIPILIHTVLTKYNIDKTIDIGETLIKLGVKRWDLFGVNYSEKCKNIFDDIKVDSSQVSKNGKMLIEKFGSKICITHSLEEDYSANGVLLVNSKGQFFVDGVTNGIKFIGADSTRPNIDEVNQSLNYKRHLKRYLKI